MTELFHLQKKISFKTDNVFCSQNVSNFVTNINI